MKIKPSKIWRLKIRSSDGKEINPITMIDSTSMSREECHRHLCLQFSKDRIVGFECD